MLWVQFQVPLKMLTHLILVKILPGSYYSYFRVEENKAQRC